MFSFDEVIRKYHIPELDSINQDSLLFKYGSLYDLEIGVSNSLTKSLGDLSGDNRSKNIDSFQLMQKILLGDIFHKIPSVLYFSSYSPSFVTAGDIVVLLKGKNDKEERNAALYIGKGKYLAKNHLNGALLLVGSENLSNLFPNSSRVVVRNLDTYYSEDFCKFYKNILGEGKLQLTTNKNSLGYDFCGTQPLYDTYVKELYSVYEGFNEFDSKKIINSLNERRRIKDINNNYTLDQNRNSRSFYRDANYSFSIVDHNSIDGSEVAIMSFFPDGKDIEIVQIGGNINYQEDFMRLWTVLIDFMKEYFSDMGFERMKILRGDKNIGYIHPKKTSIPEDFDIMKHQETMRLRYNVTPHRKWGFTKPDERYSYFNLKL